ncbi:hypothetical protein PCC8801_0657 [Rippkaea orientalis PCC 8801]|uniref:Uncharacterized protein n=1 Tax=Rippkaea orientalis (strain PCC 8801 / RF-1) TaxID=41431 RepID=B7JXI7_RIPO1|nr:hypothetical protein [Rippkaea orientalis]ACK64744.1 hypothetical protein PCC8801_0657 [Rippkaea orientalis PCC 8801]
MKILEQTEQVLKLEEKTNSGWCLSLFFMLFGIGFLIPPSIMFVGLTRTTRLQCDRVETTLVSCQLTNSHILSKERIEIPSGQLQGAKIVEDEGSEGNTVYLVDLVTKNGQIRTNLSPDSAQQINDFIGNQSQPDLTLERSAGDLFFFLCLIPFFLIGGSFAFSPFYSLLIFPSKIIYIFDKNLDQIVIKKVSLLNSKTEGLLKLSRVQEAKLEVIETTKSDGDKYNYYKTILKVKLDQPLPLPILTNSLDEHKKIVQAINEFLR